MQTSTYSSPQHHPLFLHAAPQGPGWPRGSFFLRGKQREIRVQDVAQVLPALAEAEQAAKHGAWVALMLAYEAAPAFDRAFRVHRAPEFPLLWAGLYERAESLSLGRAMQEAEVMETVSSPWSAQVSRQAYERAVAEIHDLIRQGEAYQVNYTIPFTNSWSRDAGEHPWAWFAAKARIQGAGFQAYFPLGSHSLLSFSPELFFSLRRDLIETRPMKGTSLRGRWLEEDLARREALAASEKNRAENVMIVDLLRNDLGRVARTGSVEPGPLYQVEPYPSVLQMTSTIKARLRTGLSLQEVFGALFPCGSVTGAPKIRAMEIINQVEPGPRRAYCGAMGYLEPGGNAVFNVPIRTVILDHHQEGNSQAVFSVGGGVVHDSTSQGEYEEIGVKMGFLTDTRPDFQLMEAMLLRDGEYFLLSQHMERLRASAQYLCFAFSEDKTRQALAKLAANRTTGRYKVRLLLERQGRVTVEAADISGGWEKRIKVGLCPWPVDSQDPFLFHKTTRREVYDRAQQEWPELDDVILVNGQGEITESCRANVVVKLGDKLITPPRGSGLLAGTYRQALLERGVIEEDTVSKETFLASEKRWLINSVRRWLVIGHVVV